MPIHSVHAEEEKQGCSRTCCPPNGELGVLNLVIVDHDAQLGKEGEDAVNQTACSGVSVEYLPWHDERHHSPRDVVGRNR